MFKLYDRVKIIHTSLPWYGLTGEIVNMWFIDGNNQRYGVRVGSYVIGFGCNEIELINKPDNKPLPLPG